jgi:hypothetical protein
MKQKDQISPLFTWHCSTRGDSDSESDGEAICFPQAAAACRYTLMIEGTHRGFAMSWLWIRVFARAENAREEYVPLSETGAP